MSLVLLESVCETLIQNIYMGCYLQFCITKKLRPVNKNLSKVHFFHILSAYAKELKITPPKKEIRG